MDNNQKPTTQAKANEPGGQIDSIDPTPLDPFLRSIQDKYLDYDQGRRAQIVEEGRKDPTVFATELAEIEKACTTLQNLPADQFDRYPERLGVALYTVKEELADLEVAARADYEEQKAQKSELENAKKDQNQGGQTNKMNVDEPKASPPQEPLFPKLIELMDGTPRTTIAYQAFLDAACDPKGFKELSEMGILHRALITKFIFGVSHLLESEQELNVAQNLLSTLANPKPQPWDQASKKELIEFNQNVAHELSQILADHFDGKDAKTAGKLYKKLMPLLSTSTVLATDKPELKKMSEVVDRMDHPFVLSPMDLDLSLIWDHNHTEFRPEKDIHEIRDKTLYPLIDPDSGGKLPVYDKDELSGAWGTPSPASFGVLSEFWDYKAFSGLAGKQNGRRWKLFEALLIKWTRKLNKVKGKVNPAGHPFPIFDRFASDCISFHLIVNFLAREKFECKRCEGCLSVNMIVNKKGAKTKSKILCLCELKHQGPRYKHQPFSSLSWLQHSPKYPAYIPLNQDELAYHLMVLYSYQDKQVTFIDENLCEPELTIYDLINNKVQQEGFLISPDSIPQYDRNFLVTTLGFQKMKEESHQLLPEAASSNDDKDVSKPAEKFNVSVAKPFILREKLSTPPLKTTVEVLTKKDEMFFTHSCPRMKDGSTMAVKIQDFKGNTRLQLDYALAFGNGIKDEKESKYNAIPFVPFTGRIYQDKASEFLCFETSEKLGRRLDVVLDDPSVYDHKKIVAKLAATIDKLVSGSKLAYGFDIMDGFVEGYDEYGHLRDTFLVFCPSTVDMESDNKGWVWCCQWQCSLWNAVKIYQGHLHRNQIVSHILQVCCLMIVLALTGPDRYWRCLAKIHDASNSPKGHSKPDIRNFLREEGLETYLKSQWVQKMLSLYDQGSQVKKATFLDVMRDFEKNMPLIDAPYYTSEPEVDAKEIYRRSYFGGNGNHNNKIQDPVYPVNYNMYFQSQLASPEITGGLCKMWQMTIEAKLDNVTVEPSKMCHLNPKATKLTTRFLQLLVIPEVENAVKRLPLKKHKAAKLNYRMWTQLAFSTTAFCRTPLKQIALKKDFITKCQEMLKKCLNLSDEIVEALFQPKILLLVLTDTYLLANHPTFETAIALFGYLVDQYYGVGEEGEQIKLTQSDVLLFIRGARNLEKGSQARDYTLLAFNMIFADMQITTIPNMPRFKQDDLQPKPPVTYDVISANNKSLSKLNEFSELKNDQRKVVLKAIEAQLVESKDFNDQHIQKMQLALEKLIPGETVHCFNGAHQLGTREEFQAEVDMFSNAILSWNVLALSFENWQVDLEQEAKIAQVEALKDSQDYKVLENEKAAQAFQRSDTLVGNPLPEYKPPSFLTVENVEENVDPNSIALVFEEGLPIYDKGKLCPYVTELLATFMKWGTKWTKGAGIDVETAKKRLVKSGYTKAAGSERWNDCDLHGIQRNFQWGIGAVRNKLTVADPSITADTIILVKGRVTDLNGNKKWEAATKVKELDMSKMVKVTFQELYTANIVNTMYPSFIWLYTNTSELDELWNTLAGALCSNFKMVCKLQSAWFFDKEIAKNVVKTVSHPRGYRFLFARCNLYLAGMEAKEPFNFAKVVLDETGSEVLLTATHSIKREHSYRHALRIRDIGPETPPGFLSDKIANTELTTAKKCDILECLEYADVRAEHSSLLKAVDVLIRVTTRHLDNEDPRITDYWKGKADIRPKHDFTTITEAKFKQMQGLFQQLDRFELILDDEGLLAYKSKKTDVKAKTQTFANSLMQNNPVPRTFKYRVKGFDSLFAPHKAPIIKRRTQFKADFQGKLGTSGVSAHYNAAYFKQNLLMHEPVLKNFDLERDIEYVNDSTLVAFLSSAYTNIQSIFGTSLPVITQLEKQADALIDLYTEKKTQYTKVYMELGGAEPDVDWGHDADEIVKLDYATFEIICKDADSNTSSDPSGIASATQLGKRGQASSKKDESPTMVNQSPVKTQKGQSGSPKKVTPKNVDPLKASNRDKVKSGTIKYVFSLSSRRRQMLTMELKDQLLRMDLFEAWQLENFDELDALCLEVEELQATISDASELWAAMSGKRTEIVTIVQRVKEEREAKEPNELKRQNKKMADDLKSQEKGDKDDFDQDQDDDANDGNPGGAGGTKNHPVDKSGGNQKRTNSQSSAKGGKKSGKAKITQSESSQKHTTTDVERTDSVSELLKHELPGQNASPKSNHNMKLRSQDSKVQVPPDKNESKPSQANDVDPAQAEKQKLEEQMEKLRQNIDAKMQSQHSGSSNSAKGLVRYGFKPNVGHQKKRPLNDPTQSAQDDGIQSPLSKFAKNDVSQSVDQSDNTKTTNAVSQVDKSHVSAKVIDGQMELHSGGAVKSGLVTVDSIQQKSEQPNAKENEELDLNKEDSLASKSQPVEEAKTADNVTANLPKVGDKPNDTQDKPDDTAQHQNDASDYVEVDGKVSAVEQQNILEPILEKKEALKDPEILAQQVEKKAEAKNNAAVAEDKHEGKDQASKSQETQASLNKGQE